MEKMIQAFDSEQASYIDPEQAGQRDSNKSQPYPAIVMYMDGDI